MRNFVYNQRFVASSVPANSQHPLLFRGVSPQAISKLNYIYNFGGGDGGR